MSTWNGERRRELIFRPFMFINYDTELPTILQRLANYLLVILGSSEDRSLEPPPHQIDGRSNTKNRTETGDSFLCLELVIRLCSLQIRDSTNQQLVNTGKQQSSRQNLFEQVPQ